MSHHLYTRLWGIAVLGIGLGVWMSMGCGGGSGSTANDGNPATMPYSSVSKVSFTGGAKSSGVTHVKNTTRTSTNKIKTKGKKGLLKDSFSGAAGTIGGSVISIYDVAFNPCDFTFDSPTATGIEVTAPGDPYADANKHITCTVTQNNDDLTCGISCEGTVPSNAATDADSFTIHAIFSGQVQTNAPDTTGMVRLDTLATDWNEFVLNNLTNVSIVTTGCDGDAGEVQLGANVFDDISLHALNYGYHIAALSYDNDPLSTNYGLSTCGVETTYTATMPLTGAAVGGSNIDLSRGTIQETLEICDTAGTSANDATCPPGGANTYSVGGTITGLGAGQSITLYHYIDLASGDYRIQTIQGTGQDIPYSFPYIADHQYYIYAYSNAWCYPASNSFSNVFNGTVSGNTTNLNYACNSAVGLFVTDSAYQGNLKGSYSTAREGADAKCTEAHSEQNLPSCNHITALLSVNSGDEVQNIPTNYGVPTDRPILAPHSGLPITLCEDWNGVISSACQPQYTVGMYNASWTGSNFDGSIVSDKTCNGWTDSTSNYAGQRNSIWEDSHSYLSTLYGSSYSSCNNSQHLLCLCY